MVRDTKKWVLKYSRVIAMIKFFEKKFGLGGHYWGQNSLKRLFSLIMVASNLEGWFGTQSLTIPEIFMKFCWKFTEKWLISFLTSILEAVYVVKVGAWTLKGCHSLILRPNFMKISRIVKLWGPNQSTKFEATIISEKSLLRLFWPR